MSLLITIKETFKPFKNEEKAQKMSAYMRSKFPFLGIYAATRKKLIKNILKKLQPNLTTIEATLIELFMLAEREYQYIALDLLEHVKEKLYTTHIELVKRLILTKSWWDTVDVLAPKIIGSLFLKHPEQLESYNQKWVNSENIWLNRTSLIFQLRYKEQTNTSILFQNIISLKRKNNFFIKKAIGWALREYAKTNPQKVLEFLAKNNLPRLSRTQAMKYLKELK